MTNLPWLIVRAHAEFFKQAERLERARGLYFAPAEAINETTVIIAGRKYLSVASNLYHGPGKSPEVVAEVQKVIEQYGMSCGGSPVLNQTSLHKQIELQIAQYVKMPAGTLLPTGFNSNAAAIPHLVEPGDTVFSDERNHASIWAGCRALPPGVGFQRYRHNDVDSLRRRLKRLHSPALVVTDAVFSMEGDLAPLKELERVCKESGAALMVDEAHGLGVYGSGRGYAAECGVQPTFMSLTLSKSLASVGGVFLGPAEVIEVLRLKMPQYLFSANLPAPNVAAALAALHRLEREPWRIARLHTVAERLRQGLRTLGLQTNERGPIVSVFLRTPEGTFAYAHALMARGIFVNPVIAPGVQKGQELIRCTVNSQHSDPEIDQVIDAFAAVIREQGLPGQS